MVFTESFLWMICGGFEILFRVHDVNENKKEEKNLIFASDCGNSMRNVEEIVNAIQCTKGSEVSLKYVKIKFGKYFYFSNFYKIYNAF